MASDVRLSLRSGVGSWLDELDWGRESGEPFTGAAVVTGDWCHFHVPPLHRDALAP